MFLFEYIIKLLMGNSETLFMGLFVVVFGYYGWLLYNINDYFKEFLKKWNKHEESLEELRSKMKELDESVYKELISKLNTNVITLEKINSDIKENSVEMDRYRSDIIAEIKESSEEIKEIMKLLMNRSRNYKTQASTNKVENKKE